MDGAAGCFWLLTALNAGISLRFVLNIRRVHAARPSPSNLVLAAGQRKDNWLLAGVIWAAAVLKPWDHIEWFLLGATPVLLWLLQRTFNRLRVLAR